MNMHRPNQYFFILWNDNIFYSREKTFWKRRTNAKYHSNAKEGRREEKGGGCLRRNLGHNFWNNRNDKYAFFWKRTIIYECPITSPIADSLNFSSKTFAPIFYSFYTYFGKKYPPPFRKTEDFKRIAKISIFDIALGKSQMCVFVPECVAPACNGASPTASFTNKSSNLGRRQIAEKLTNF